MRRSEINVRKSERFGGSRSRSMESKRNRSSSRRIYRRTMESRRQGFRIRSGIVREAGGRGESVDVRGRRRRWSKRRMRRRSRKRRGMRGSKTKEGRTVGNASGRRRRSSSSSSCSSSRSISSRSSSSCSACSSSSRRGIRHSGCNRYHFYRCLSDRNRGVLYRGNRLRYRGGLRTAWESERPLPRCTTATAGGTVLGLRKKLM